MTMILTEKKNDIILRDYQKEAISFLNDNDGKLVLAMCPSSGKTETIIYYLNQQHNINPNLKVLILPHSTNVLLDNFYERITKRNVGFDYSTDVNDDVNVHIVLPQNHNKITSEYDLIIVDEAHENYLAKTIQGIIKNTKVKKQILLTGTPYQFINKSDFKLYFVALSDMDSSYIPKLRIDILESDYDWNGNYSSTKELSNSYKFSKKLTETSLKRTFDFLLNRNNLNSIEKTLIICRDISQSEYVRNYLSFIGFYSEISNSQNDKNSIKINDFKNNLLNILIVVNRARLGYDDVDLVNLIDISGTLNPNVIYQMFARLLRGTQDKQKYYIRLTSKNDDVYNSEIATSVALMLTHSNYISNFDGKGFRQQDIIVNEEFFVKSKKSLESKSNKKNTLNKRRLLIDFQDDKKNDFIRFFKSVIEQKEKQVGLYKFCKVSEVLNELSINTYTSRTKEECIENAQKYNSIKEWAKNDKTLQSYAYSKEWYVECIAHMDKLNGISKTKQECIENALNYDYLKEWKEKDRTFYSYAQGKGWYYECTEHMKQLGGKSRTKEECIESARRYKSKSDWRKNESTTYAYACNNGWFSECSSHMINLGGETRTKEECIENARKYNTCKDWIKHEKNIYMYSQRKGWLEDCMAHMEKLITRRTKEECIENARKYSSVKEWRKNDKSIQVYSKNKEWYAECIAHMEDSKNTKKTNLYFKYTKEYCIEIGSKYNSAKEWENDETHCKILNFVKRVGWYNECRVNMNKKRVFRSKQECIENARKYNSITDWFNNDNAFYSYAKSKKDWYEECISHMEYLSTSRTKEECIENARKYTSIKEWRKKDSKFYNYSKSKNGWYEECIAHMTKLRNFKTKEECFNNSKQYKSFTEWTKNEKTTYGYARRKGWTNEIKLNF